MEALHDDFLADFGRHSQSQGITSLLRECIGDDESFEEVESVQLQSGLQPQVAEAPSIQAAACQSMFFSLPSHLELQPQTQDLQAHWTSLHKGRGPVTRATSACQAGETQPQTQSFSLGTHEDLHAAAFRISEVAGATGRRRGRKPKPGLPDLQQRLAGLAKQLQSLTDENLFLRNKLKVLERVVPYRDESVSFLTQLLASGNSQAQPCTNGNAGAKLPALSNPLIGELPGSQHDREQSPISPDDGNSAWSEPASAAGTRLPAASDAQSSNSRIGGTGKSCGRGSTSITTEGTPARVAPALAPISTSGAAVDSRLTSQAGGGSLPPGTPAVVALCPCPDGEVPAITAAAVEELKRVSPQDFRALWKHVCLQLGVLVTGAEVHGPGSSPYVRLERFLERALSYMDKITLLSPACFVHSMYTNVENGQHERPNDNFWITCARSLQLNHQQLREVATLASVYEQNVIPVMQQRLQLAMQLSSRLATDPVQPASSGDTQKPLPTVDELAQQLERNVLKEHQTHWTIGDFLCSSVLTPLQIAKALTVAYPYIPDGVAMLHAFKLLTGDGEQAVTKPAAASSSQAPSGGHQFPSLAGMLMAHLPALAGIMSAGMPSQDGSAPAAPQFGKHKAMAATVAPIESAALFGNLVSGLQPAQLQGLLAAVPAAQLQGIAATLQPTQLLGLLGALQPDQLQGLVSALQPAQLQSLLGALSPVQLQGLLSALQPAQLQGLLSVLNPAQLQGTLAALQPMQLQAMLGGLQAATFMGRARGPSMQPMGAAPTPMMLQGGGPAGQPGLGALLAAVVAGVQAAGRH